MPFPFENRKSGVKKAIFVTICGKVSSGKNIPEKRKLGVNNSVKK